MKLFPVTKLWLIALAVSLLPLAPSLAASELSVLPRQLEGDIRSGFIFNIKHGDEVEDVVEITNKSGRPFDLLIAARDASYAANGSLVVADTNTQVKGLGGWITFEQSELTLGSGESTEVGFKVTVPSDASIGEHYAGIVVYEKNTINNVTANTSVRVIVPGKVQRELSWGKISHKFEKGKLVFDVTAKNESNINLQPSLDIEYKGVFGKARQNELAPAAIAPGGTIKLQPTWQHQTPILGFYKYQLTLHTLSVTETLPDGTVNNLADEQITTTYSFFTGGPLLVGIILLLLFLWLLRAYLAFAKDKRKYMTHTTHRKVKAGESLMYIASETGITPKQLIKFNHLAWPYTLAAGDTILIPGRRLHRTELHEKHPEDVLPSFFAYLTSFKSSLYHPRANKVEQPAKAAAVKPKTKSKPKKANVAKTVRKKKR